MAMRFLQPGVHKCMAVYMQKMGAPMGAPMGRILEWELRLRDNAQLMSKEHSSLFFCLAKFRDKNRKPQPSSTALRNKTRPAGALRGRTEGYIACFEQLPKVTAPSFLHVTPKYYYLRLVVPLIVINFVWAQPVNLVWCEKRTVQVCGPWRQALSSTGSANGTE